MLAAEAGARAGRFRTSTVEVARGPMLAVTEPGVQVLTAQVCTQLLKTTLLENIFGFFAHLDPCPMLLVQPGDTDAEGFSKERIGPMISATPVLRELVGTRKTRSAEETLTYKAFPGGFLALVGAGSPRNLARRPVRVVLYDEVDKYVVTREGDPIALGDERLATFETRALSVRVCSPTEADNSRIEKSFLSSDQRRCSVACPHCGHRQFLDFEQHVRWEKSEEGRHLPKTARVYCEACNEPWEEGQRRRALQTARWHQTRPFTCCGERQEPLAAYRRAWHEDGAADPVDVVWAWWSGPRHAVYRAKCWTCGAWAVDNEHAGFQGGKEYSPFTRDSPAHMAAKWVEAKDDEDLRKAFVNTQLAKTYRYASAKDVDVEQLAARRETWSEGEVPDGVALLTCGLDTQDAYVQVETVGWGRDGESWSIDARIIPGAMDDPTTQRDVDEYLQRRWTRADGRSFVVEAACFDSGGHHTQKVYEFCQARLGRRVWAIKGASERPGARQPVWPAKIVAQAKRATFRPISIGTNAAKDWIRDQLARTGPGPGYMHFPRDRDIDWFTQLLAERVKIVVKAGAKLRVWEQIKGRANEALDCRVYAYAALCGLRVHGMGLNRRAAEMARRDEPRAPEAEPPPSREDLEQPPPAAPQPSPEPAPAPVAPSSPGKAVAGRGRKSMASRYAALSRE